MPCHISLLSDLPDRCAPVLPSPLHCLPPAAPHRSWRSGEPRSPRSWPGCRLSRPPCSSSRSALAACGKKQDPGACVLLADCPCHTLQVRSSHLSLPCCFGCRSSAPSTSLPAPPGMPGASQRPSSSQEQQRPRAPLRRWHLRSRRQQQQQQQPRRARLRRPRRPHLAAC